MSVEEYVPPRVITVPPELWDTVQDVLAVSDLLLYAVPAAPGQAQRFELRQHAVRRQVRGRAALGLSDRERQILRGISQGLSNGQIGDQLFLSEDTVKSHNQALFRKLGVRNRSQAVAVAIERDLLGGES